MLEQFAPRLQVAEVELTEPAGKVAVRLEVCDGCHTDLYSPGADPSGAPRT